MKIKYVFANGDVSEVEVSEEIGAIVIDSRKAEHAQQEKERYHCYSLDAIDFEGAEYGRCDDYSEDDAEAETARHRAILHKSFSLLTETQKRRLLLSIRGKTVREIAGLENVDVRAVQDSLTQARKKFPRKFS